MITLDNGLKLYEASDKPDLLTVYNDSVTLLGEMINDNTDSIATQRSRINQLDSDISGLNLAIQSIQSGNTIQNGAITYEKLAEDAALANIGIGGLQNEYLSEDAISTSVMQDGCVTYSKISNDAILDLGIEVQTPEGFIDLWGIVYKMFYGEDYNGEYDYLFDTLVSGEGYISLVNAIINQELLSEDISVNVDTQTNRINDIEAYFPLQSALIMDGAIVSDKLNVDVYTDEVEEDSTKLVTSGAVFSALSNMSESSSFPYEFELVEGSGNLADGGSVTNVNSNFYNITWTGLPSDANINTNFFPLPHVVTMKSGGTVYQRFECIWTQLNEIFIRTLDGSTVSGTPTLNRFPSALNRVYALYIKNRS